MCAIEHTACEIHGASFHAHTLCPNTTDPLSCTNVLYVQRLGVALPEAIRFINSISRFNRVIAAMKSTINTAMRAAGVSMSLASAILELRGRATMKLTHLQKELPQQEYQLLQELSRPGLLILRNLEKAHREQKQLKQELVGMLEQSNLELQKLICERRSVIIMLRTTVWSQLVAGAGQGQFGACRCNIFNFGKL